VINSSRERVVACTQLSADLWRDMISPEIVWESLRAAASEFRYRNPVIDSDTLFIEVSQSGETLAHEPDISREVQYMRFMKGEDGLIDGLIETGCAEGDADFVTLRLVVWAEPPEGTQDGEGRDARRQ
jgi:hypothetical protein